MSNLSEEIQEAIKNENAVTGRYEGFTLLSQPKRFNELFKDKEFDYIQYHSTDIYEVKGTKYIVGFCGASKYQDNKLISLDGDTYNENPEIYGYEYFSNEEEGIKNGLEILVGDDW